MRAYHQAVADFVPPPGAVWREGGTWSPGLIIGHNDTAPYNAAWHQGTLAGFFDWDFAGPATPAWDLAFAAFSWVPLHARHVVAAEGFTDFAARPRRLRRFLRTYGWRASETEFLEVVRARVRAHADASPRSRRRRRRGVRAAAQPGCRGRPRPGSRRTRQSPAIALPGGPVLPPPRLVAEGACLIGAG